jgi:outer membrane protein assembly factor BamB
MNAWTILLPILSAGAFVLICLPLDGADFDWPRWRGAQGNGISKETDWSSSWPASGPKQLWKAQIGVGFSSVAVAENRLYTMGNEQNADIVFCLDAATGRELWRHSYPAERDPKLYEGGPNSTPTVDDGSLYTLGRKGELFCLDAKTGKVRWSKMLLQDFDLKEGGKDWWGFTGSPLVEGALLILNAGTSGLALEKKTGKQIWNTGKEVTGYASPVSFSFAGTRGVAIFAAKAVVGLDSRTGRELWRFPWKTSYDINAADPIMSGNEMFVSSGYRTGGALLRLNGSEWEVVWKGQQMHSQMNPSVLVAGHLYGISGQNGHGGELRCVEWKTGIIKWQEPSLQLGSLMAAADKLIVLSEKGELVIAEASPERFKVLARTQVLGGRCWTVPVLSNGRIYCRNASGKLICVDVSSPDRFKLN